MNDVSAAAPPTFTYCPDPVFVFGAPRSGTTALARALGMHGDFYVGDETFFLWELYGQGRVEKVFEQWATRPSSSWLRREQVSRDASGSTRCSRGRPVTAAGSITRRITA